MRTPRLRFSLISLATLMTISALGFGLYSSARRNTELEKRNQVLAEENKSYRSELGIFEIEDPQQFHAIQVPREDGQPRRYRVYLPPGRNYTMHYKVNGIPERDIPSRSTDNSLEPGKYLFNVSIERQTDDKTGQPIPHAVVKITRERYDGQNSGRSSSHIFIGEEKNRWILNKDHHGMTFSWQEIGRKLETSATDKPLVIYRARAHSVIVIQRGPDGIATSWSSTSIEGECDGFMVWITSDGPNEQ